MKTEAQSLPSTKQELCMRSNSITQMGDPYGRFLPWNIVMADFDSRICYKVLNPLMTSFDNEGTIREKMGQKKLEYDPKPLCYSAKFQKFLLVISRNLSKGQILCIIVSFHTKDKRIKQPSHRYSLLLNCFIPLWTSVILDPKQFSKQILAPFQLLVSMAKNQTGTDSEGVCEKICKAICCVSCCPQSSEPTSAAPTEVISAEVPINFNTPVSQTPSKAREQTTKTHTSIQKNGQGHNQVTRVAPNNELVPARVAEFEKAKPKAERASSAANAGSSQGQHDSKGEEGKNQGLDNSDGMFSSYIDRAKANIRTTTSVGVGSGGGGGGKLASRLDSFNDKVTNYINRAKLKIRSNSNVGVGRRTLSIK